MREWNIKAGDPLSLILSADPRLGKTDYCDDQIWELSLSGGEPPALALQTTYGLRARSMRLFPRFGEADVINSDPVSFATAPVVRNFYSNFMQVAFSPLPDIVVEAEYWVPGSKVIAGHIEMKNQGNRPRQVRFEWAGVLTPSDTGQRMAPVEMANSVVLAGSTAGLYPVVFITGGPAAGKGPYPSLALEIDLPALETKQVRWAHAALADPQASLDLARQTVATNWEAERARLKLLNEGQVEIYTGNPDWDAAFAMSQKMAYTLFIGPTQKMPDPSIVIARRPDQGFSLRGDGSDYNHLWNGQTPLDVLHLLGFILPGSADLAQGLLRNYLVTQSEVGFVDWKPGLAGQRSQLLATPILATIAMYIYKFTQDLDFLEDVYPALLDFFRTWLDPHQDRDCDGVPEWDHPMQTGFDDHPVFAYWHAWAQGIDISTTESPSLCSFLFKECHSLIEIGNLLGRLGPIDELQAIADNLRSAVEASWDDKSSIYRYWDRDSHYSPPLIPLGERFGSGEIPIAGELEIPARIFTRVYADGEHTRRVQLFVHGNSPSGQHRIERIPNDHFQWYLGLGSVTGERIYQSLDRVEIQGLQDKDRAVLYAAGYNAQDDSLLLPLWAGIPTPKRARALVKKTITAARKFWKPFGIQGCIVKTQSSESSPCQHIRIPWNVLIGQGFLAYGFRKEAAELVTRLMAAIIQTLKREGAFYRHYHAKSGQGLGERNALEGLAPLSLFMTTLGLQIISQHRVLVSGYNPFPWPVTVKYRGMTVFRQKEKTTVIFPDGQIATVNEQTPCVVSLQ